MDAQNNQPERPVNPRRRKRSKMQIFKEVYLPVIIAGLAILLILIFIIGSIVRAVQKNKAEIDASIASSYAQAAEEERQQQEADALLAQAAELAAGYDYDGAIALLNTFSGEMNNFPQVNDQIVAYEKAKSKLVAWDDPSKVVNLSFQLLVADPDRGFSHDTYGYSINRNFVTTEEFSKILQQLYDNGYILVGLDDIVSVETGSDGQAVYKPKTLYLPNGKKPVMLTQTNVNYNYYLIDSNGDKVPDAGGTGIASKLLWDGSKFYNEMVDASGQTVTGNYDLVPILEAFVAKNPGFSYRGAKAVLALTGYNGLFGYRTHPSAKELFGEDAYNQAVKDAKAVATALRDNGYTLACYTYENIGYGDSSLSAIKSDMSGWTEEVVPLLGNLDILVYAQVSDITSETVYAGEKYDTLRNLGFRYYLGFCLDGKPWMTVTNNYVRQGRILVTGANMAHHADWFASLFDAAGILDPDRGNVPQ